MECLPLPTPPPPPLPCKLPLHRLHSILRLHKRLVLAHTRLNIALKMSGGEVKLDDSLSASSTLAVVPPRLLRFDSTLACLLHR